MAYYDSKENAVYITTNRNGSTLLKEISQVADTFNPLVGYKDLVELISTTKNVRIYFPFREPKTRFLSGLTVNLYNKTDFKLNYDPLSESVPERQVLDKYKWMLEFLDNSVGDGCNILTTIYRRPYHLYDTHLDHWFAIPLIFMSYGYTVTPLAFHRLSSHLLERFPEATDFIKKRERPNSFSEPRPHYYDIWNVYKEIFIDKTPTFYNQINPKHIISWDKWMEPEIEIFNTFRQYIGTDKQQYSAHKLINRYLDKKIYFNDFYSPNANNIFHTINNIHLFKEENPRLVKLAEYYETTRNGLIKTVDW